MNIDYFLFQNLLLPIKLPSGWCLSKNYLFDFNLEWLNSLNDEDKFKVSEVYLYEDIYISKIIMNGYLSLVSVSVYPETKNGIYNKISYEISISIYGKNNKLLKYFEYPISNIYKIIKAIEIISLDIYYYIGDEGKDENMEKVFFNLNKFLHPDLDIS